MDEAVSRQLDVLSRTALSFYEARSRRNPDYDWLTQAEGAALSNLRDAIITLDLIAESRMKGRAASAA